MVIILIMIIKRPAETIAINKGNWLLIYGRRKTGKTFIVENFIKYDEFFFIKRDRLIIEKKEWKDYNYDTLKELLRRDLSLGKTVVIDEFHRLGEDFLDFLHAIPQKGKLILISSTLHLSKKLIGTSSPLLGKFGEVNIGLIDLRDVLRAMKIKQKGKKDTLEKAVLLREPLVVNLIGDGDLADVILKLKFTSPALLGEVFTEEDRKLSGIYEGIIRAISIGKATSGEICSFLFSKKLIKKDDPSIIQQYFTNLVYFGILGRISIWNKNRNVYKHISPILRIFYYLDEKYNFAERDISKRELQSYLDEIIPKIMEDSLRDLLGQILGMKIFIYEASDLELDGIYSKFKKPKVALEVKWEKNIRNEDIKKAEANLGRIRVPRKVLFVPDKKGLQSDDIEIMDIDDILT